MPAQKPSSSYSRSQMKLIPELISGKELFDGRFSTKEIGAFVADKKISAQEAKILVDIISSNNDRVRINRANLLKLCKTLGISYRNVKSIRKYLEREILKTRVSKAVQKETKTLKKNAEKTIQPKSTLIRAKKKQNVLSILDTKQDSSGLDLNRALDKPKKADKPLPSARSMLDATPKTIAFYEGKFAKYKNKIKTKADLRRICAQKSMNIDVEDLQRVLGFRGKWVDGVIGDRTFERFMHNVMHEKIYSTQKNGKNTMNPTQKQRARSRAKRAGEEVIRLKSRPRTKEELIAATPIEFRSMMKEFFTKKISNSPKKESLRNLDVSRTPLIFLSKTRTNRGLAYVDGNIHLFNIIDNESESMTDTVIQFDEMLIGETDYTITSNGEKSNTVIGATFKFQGVKGFSPGAKWTHGVAPGRIDGLRRGKKYKTQGCIGIKPHRIRDIAKKMRKYAHKVGEAEKKERKGPSGWPAKAGKAQRYKLDRPMFNYTA
ncbi:hypothetical protein CSB09_02055 [Candidatus Gracilibacteria bacterium]|nr:MAG: hypothetical protein CSB09_02055 [Candidatus Gracilibacteria bacterium]